MGQNKLGKSLFLFIHLFIFKLIQGSGNVMEGTKGTSPLKIHTTDTDTRLTAAWRVRYSIQGDKVGYFSIHTDPDTNDGILTVIKVCLHTVSYSVNVIRVFTISSQKKYYSGILSHLEVIIRARRSTVRFVSLENCDYDIALW